LAHPDHRIGRLRQSGGDRTQQKGDHLRGHAEPGADRIELMHEQGDRAKVGANLVRRSRLFSR
jgi:hypothetical protein